MCALHMTIVYYFLQKAAATSVVHLLIGDILAVATQHGRTENSGLSREGHTEQIRARASSATAQ